MSSKELRRKTATLQLPTSAADLSFRLPAATSWVYQRYSKGPGTDASQPRARIESEDWV